MENKSYPIVRMRKELFEIEKKLSERYGISRRDLRKLAYAYGLLIVIGGLKADKKHTLKKAYPHILSMLEDELRKMEEEDRQKPAETEPAR